jgi:hypothetical protein
MEQRMRKAVADRDAEGLKQYVKHIDWIDGAIDESEAAFGQRDMLQRSPPGARDDIAKQLAFLDQFHSPRPLWGAVLGVTWRVGDTLKAMDELGDEAALGAFAVVAFVLLKRRHNDKLAELASGVLGSTITSRRLAYRREAFLRERGYPSLTRAVKMSNERGVEN